MLDKFLELFDPDFVKFEFFLFFLEDQQLLLFLYPLLL